MLIEFKVVLFLRGLGHSTRHILKVRNIIAEEEKLAYPFASRKLLANSKDILYRTCDDIVSTDGKQQLNFEACVRDYYKLIDFTDDMASRFHPIGRENSIIVDPRHQFGQPVIDGSNTTAETIYQMHFSGEPVERLSLLYDIPVKKIQDAIKFYEHAA